MKKYLSTTFDVMIIAQSATTIETIRHLLRHSGATMHVVSSGFDAILCSNVQRFDLVLCDCDLADPMLAEALLSMRTDTRHARVPMIGMSRQLSDIGAAFASSRMSGWLAVPLDEAEFAAMLAKWHPLAARSGPVPKPGLARGRASPSTSLDVAQALGRLRGNASLYRTILRRFVDAYPATADVFKRAAATSDHRLASSAIHDLRALAGTIGATDLVAALTPLTYAPASGGGRAFKAELETMMEQFRLTLAEVLGYLEKTAPVLAMSSEAS